MGGIQGMRRTCRPWQDQELSLEKPQFLPIPAASCLQHTQSLTNRFCHSESPKITAPIAHGLSQS